MKDRCLVDELDEIIRMLSELCPTGFINSKRPDPRCCPYHHAAKVLVDIQAALKEIPSGET
jgi:hypothetical protein